MRRTAVGLGLLGHLSVASGIAFAAVAMASTASEAQFSSFRSHNMAPRAPMIGNSPGMRSFEPRMRDRSFSRRSKDDVRSDKGRRTGGKVTTTEEPPRNPGRRPPRRPPGINPGFVPGAATGVIIGAVPPANALPPPPLPPRAPSGPPSGGGASPVMVNIPAANEQRFVKDEVVLEFPGNVTPQQSQAVAARHRLTRIESAYFPLTDTTWFRWKINDGRSVRAVLRALSREGALRSMQPNYIFRAGQKEGATFVPLPSARPKATPVVAAAGARPAGGDPAQYTLVKLRVPEAHEFATGSRVLVAVIDSGVDAGHPELQGVIAGTFDALGKDEPPHAHGTAIAGAIASRAKLMGVAPQSRILAIRPSARREPAPKPPPLRSSKASRMRSSRTRASST
jgi:hypothetical protein